MKRGVAKGRFNLSMEQELLDKLEQVADENRITVTDVFRKSSKLLLVGEEAKKKGGGLYVRRDEKSEHEKIDVFGL